MSQIRAFLAIDIDEDLKAKIYNVIRQFKQIDANIKYVDLENLHLTLKFSETLTQKALTCFHQRYPMW